LRLIVLGGNMRKDFKKVLHQAMKEAHDSVMPNKLIRSRVKHSRNDEDGEYHSTRTSLTKHRGWDRKLSGLNYTLLRRWIRKQVGRPWDKVYSEICKHNPDTRTQMCLENYINVNVVTEDGRAYRRDGGGWRSHGELYCGDLYVDPNDKIIKVYKKNKRKKYERKPVEGFIQIDDCTSLNKIDGQWFVVGWVDFPPDAKRPYYLSEDYRSRIREVPVRDLLLGDTITRKSHYGRFNHDRIDHRARISGKYAKTKRSANKKILKKHGVRK
jgi:hypothetical protein